MISGVHWVRRTCTWRLLEASGWRADGGAGPVKHLATASLWLQDAVFRRELKLLNVRACDNVAGSGTRPLSSPELARLTAIMGYELRHEPASGALQSAWAMAG